MTVSVATPEDLDWIVAVLTQRREPLVECAPVFWQPAPDAEVKHRAFIAYLLTEDGAKAYRTDDSVLIAAPRGDGWLIDDAYIQGELWASGDGRDLWNAFDADCRGAEVRLVCPTYEQARAEFAQAVGLALAESWWLMELPNSGGGEAAAQVTLPGADAITVGAPPVYAPPGPILLLRNVTNTDLALPAAISKAPEFGCAAIVVNETAAADGLARSLAAAGFRQHCDFYTGIVYSIWRARSGLGVNARTSPDPVTSRGYPGLPIPERRPRQRGWNADRRTLCEKA